MYGEQEGTMPHFYLKSPFISHEFVCTWPFYFKFTASTVPPQISWVCNTWFISLPVIYTFYSEALHVQNIRRVKLQALRPLVYVCWNGKKWKYHLIWKCILSCHSICKHSLQQSDSSHANCLIFLRGKKLINRYWPLLLHSVLNKFLKLRDIYII